MDLGKLTAPNWGFCFRMGRQRPYIQIMIYCWTLAGYWHSTNKRV